jgi:hypothetical protein
VDGSITGKGTVETSCGLRFSGGASTGGGGYTWRVRGPAHVNTTVMGFPATSSDKFAKTNYHTSIEMTHAKELQIQATF